MAAESDALMIRCNAIIPIDQHPTYYGENDLQFHEDLDNFRFPEYDLDSALCYTELEMIVAKTPA